MGWKVVAHRFAQVSNPTRKFFLRSKPSANRTGQTLILTWNLVLPNPPTGRPLATLSLRASFNSLLRSVSNSFCLPPHSPCLSTSGANF